MKKQIVAIGILFCLTAVKNSLGTTLNFRTGYSGEYLFTFDNMQPGKRTWKEIKQQLKQEISDTKSHLEKEKNDLEKKLEKKLLKIEFYKNLYSKGFNIAIAGKALKDTDTVPLDAGQIGTYSLILKKQ